MLFKQNKDDYKIQVRVTRVWESINKMNNQVMFTNIILLDEENNHILATIRNNQKDVYMPLLSEGEVCTITNVKVLPGPVSYRAVDGDLALSFYYKTQIKKVVDKGVIPQYKFELKRFEDLLGQVADVKNFIDVVALVLSYGQLETRSNGARKLDVALADSRNDKVVVSLWEGKTTSFLEQLAATGVVAVFGVFTRLMAKKYSGIKADGKLYSIDGVMEAARAEIGYYPGVKCNSDKSGQVQLRQIYICVDTSASEIIESPGLPNSRCTSSIRFAAF